MCAIASESAQGHPITRIAFETKLPDRVSNQIEGEKKTITKTRLQKFERKIRNPRKFAFDTL